MNLKIIISYLLCAAIFLPVSYSNVIFAILLLVLVLATICEYINEYFTSKIRKEVRSEVKFQLREEKLKAKVEKAETKIFTATPPIEIESKVSKGDVESDRLPCEQVIEKVQEKSE